MENQLIPRPGKKQSEDLKSPHLGRLTGQKPALKMKEVWAIRTRLEMENDSRNLALFNLALDSKLRGCDLVQLKVGDIASGSEVRERAIIIQKKTGRPVTFEITENTRKSIKCLLNEYCLQTDDYLFQSHLCTSERLSTRQYARIVRQWVGSIGLTLQPMERIL